MCESRRFYESELQYFLQDIHQTIQTVAITYTQTHTHTHMESHILIRMNGHGHSTQLPSQWNGKIKQINTALLYVASYQFKWTPAIIIQRCEDTSSHMITFLMKTQLE